MNETLSKPSETVGKKEFSRIPEEPAKVNVYSDCVGALETLKAHHKLPLLRAASLRMKLPNLDNVETSLKNGKYKETKEFISAVRDIWKAFWNPREIGQIAYIAANEISEIFENIAKKIPEGVIVPAYQATVNQQVENDRPVKKQNADISPYPTGKTAKSQATSVKLASTSAAEKKTHSTLSVQIKNPPPVSMKTQAPSSEMAISIKKPAQPATESIPAPLEKDVNKPTIIKLPFLQSRETSTKFTVPPIEPQAPAKLPKEVPAESTKIEIKVPLPVNLGSAQMEDVVGQPNHGKVPLKSPILDKLMNLKVSAPPPKPQKTPTKEEPSKPEKKTLADVNKETKDMKIKLEVMPKQVSVIQKDQEITPVKTQAEAKKPQKPTTLEKKEVKKKSKAEVELTYSKSGSFQSQILDSDSGIEDPPCKGSEFVEIEEEKGDKLKEIRDLYEHYRKGGFSRLKHREEAIPQRDTGLLSFNFSKTNYNHRCFRSNVKFISKCQY